MIAIGTTTAFRLRLDVASGRLVVDERWRPRYGPAPAGGRRAGDVYYQSLTTIARVAVA